MDKLEDNTVNEINEWAQEQTQKLKETKQGFSDTIMWILKSRGSRTAEVFDKLPQLGAMNAMLSDPEHYREMLLNAGDQIKDHPELQIIFTKLASLLEDWTVWERKKELHEEIFIKTLDENEVNDYLIIIKKIVEEIMDEYIDYIWLTKEVNIAEHEKMEIFLNKDNQKEDADDTNEWNNAIKKEEQAFNKFSEKIKEFNSHSLIHVIGTIVASMHLETDKEKGNIHPSWLSLTEKWLESILKALTKYIERSDSYKATEETIKEI